MLEQFLKFGVDIRVEPMEVAPTAHHIMGGLRIRPDGSTTMKGLFACGEVSGGVHGANRLGGNALAETQVFGKRAGEAAGKTAVHARNHDTAQVESERKRLDEYFSGGSDPAGIWRKLKLSMWEGAGIFRTLSALEQTRSVIRHLQSLQLRAATAENLVECCTVGNMLTTASLIVDSALLRPESRGAHVRKDIRQAWTPETSPFGHTYLSLSCRGIEKVNR
jgi:fumarate reductase (CoM/CoB) subunit A